MHQLYFTFLIQNFPTSLKYSEKKIILGVPLIWFVIRQKRHERTIGKREEVFEQYKTGENHPASVPNFTMAATQLSKQYPKSM